MIDLQTGLQGRVSSKAELEFYQAHGYVMLPGLLSSETARALRLEVEGIMDKIGLPMSKLRQTSDYLVGSNLDKFINSPELLAIAEQILGGPSSLYLPFTAVKSAGGGGRFHFHQDNQYTIFDGPGVNLWFALTQMTEANGCLQIVPRSHLQGTFKAIPSGDGDAHKKVQWEPVDFVAIEMQAGDCVAFSRTTIHGSGVNTTDQARIGYAVQFHRNDVRALWEDGKWRLVRDFPRFQVKPVSEISVPGEKKDGH